MHINAFDEVSLPTNNASGWQYNTLFMLSPPITVFTDSKPMDRTYLDTKLWGIKMMF